MCAFSGETATCMYNSPHEESSLPRVLPGKLLSLDAQCRKDRGTSACFKVGSVPAVTTMILQFTALVLAITQRNEGQIMQSARRIGVNPQLYLALMLTHS